MLLQSLLNSREYLPFCWFTHGALKSENHLNNFRSHRVVLYLVARRKEIDHLNSCCQLKLIVRITPRNKIAGYLICAAIHLRFSCKENTNLIICYLLCFLHLSLVANNWYWFFFNLDFSSLVEKRSWWKKDTPSSNLTTTSR